MFLPGNPGIVAVAGSPHQFVAVGYNGGVYRSSDGESWQSVTVPWNNNLFSVTHAFGRFIAVGGFGLVAQSGDGLWWEARQDIGTETLFRIASGEGRGLAVGKSGQIHSSPDGVTWRRSFFSDDGTFEAVGAGAGKYLVVTRQGIGRLSTDAVNWTRIGVPSTITALAGSDHGFIAVTATGGLLRSPEALTWQELPAVTPAQLSNLKWVGNQFLAVGAAATLLQSSNSVDWRALDTRVTGWRHLAAHGDTRLALARGGKLLRTDNGGATWQGSLTFNLEMRDIVRNPDRWWLVGNNSALMHSTDGWQWESIVLSFSTDLFALTRAQGHLVAVGAAGAVVTSPDGVDWILCPAGTTQASRDVLHDGTQFLAVGEGVFTRLGDGL